MTIDDVLTGWLCMYRLQMDGGDDVCVAVPTFVRNQFLSRGWIDDGDSLTDLGIRVTDLNAADWQIDALQYCDG